MLLCFILALHVNSGRPFISDNNLLEYVQYVLSRPGQHMAGIYGIFKAPGAPLRIACFTPGATVTCKGVFTPVLANVRDKPVSYLMMLVTCFKSVHLL